MPVICASTALKYFPLYWQQYLHLPKKMGSITMHTDPNHDNHKASITNNERIEPQLSTTDIDEAPCLERPFAASNAPTAPATGKKALGALSALTLALLCSSTAFAWWSMQRMELLEQQLIATQDSFSKISEDAAGRLNEITGQFTATESSVQGDIQTLTQRLNSLESNSIETHKQQQSSLTEQAADLTQLNTDLLAVDERTQSLNKALTQQEKTLAQHSNRLSEEYSALHKTLTEQQEQLGQFKQVADHNQQLLSQLQEKLDTQQQQLAQLDVVNTELQGLTTQLTQLQNNSHSDDELQRLQQDLLIIRSELEQRTAPTTNINPGPSLADFDAYRAQTNRTINALQEKIRHLQKNTP